jgi:VRR-NUC domain
VRKNEEAALDKFKAEGWSALRNGWPDYLLVRTNSEGKLEFMGLEVKFGNDSLSGHQLALHLALRCAGIKIEVAKVRARKSRSS